MAALLLVAVAGCADPAPPPVQAAGEGMPQLVRRPLTIAEDDKPESQYQPFDVSSTGNVAYFASQEVEPLFRILDSTGARVTSFGRAGDGPGEIRGTYSISIEGDTLRAFDGDRQTWIEMTLAGALLRERRVDLWDPILAWHADSVDHWDAVPYPEVIGQRISLIRSAIGKRDGRSLIDTTNELLASALPAGRYRLTLFVLPYAATKERFWIGDGRNYRIGSFTSQGELISDVSRSLPPNKRGPRALAIERERLLNRPKFIVGPNGERLPVADPSARLDTLERERISHFARYALHVEGRDRLWVIGSTNDSTTVDLFADTVFVGRVMLPCFSSRSGVPSAMGPGWLLLECEIDNSDWPTELQLYRIVER